MTNKLVIEKLVELIESNIDNDSKREAVVALVRAEYGVKDGSRIAKKHLLAVEEQVARAIVESGEYEGVTTKRHGEGWAICHPEGRAAAEAAKKMKQRVMNQLRDGDTSKKTRSLLDEVRSLRKKAGNAVDAGKIDAEMREAIRAELEGMSADLA